MYRVLIVSNASFIDSTAEIPFIYKKAGAIVDVFCNKLSWLLSNKFHDNWIDSGEDESETEFLNKLLHLVNSNTNHYHKIVTTDDATNKLLNDNIADPELFCKLLPLTKIENRKILSSKSGLSEVLEKYQIATPKYALYSDDLDIQKVKTEFTFPILSKVDYSFSGIGLQLIENAASLDDAIKKVYNTKNMVLQEFIQGDDIGVEALFHQGKLLMYNAANILDYMYNSFSFTTSRRYFRNKQIEALLIELGDKVGINGFASIQYVYCKKRNTYFLIEVDIRTNSWMSYGRFTGQNFSDAIRTIIDPSLNINSYSTDNKTVNIYMFDRDIRRCVKHRDYKGIIKWIFNADGRWKFIPLYDLKYFKRILSKLFGDFRKKIV